MANTSNAGALHAFCPKSSNPSPAFIASAPSSTTAPHAPPPRCANKEKSAPAATCCAPPRGATAADEATAQRRRLYTLRSSCVACLGWGGGGRCVPQSTAAPQRAHLQGGKPQRGQVTGGTMAAEPTVADSELRVDLLAFLTRIGVQHDTIDHPAAPTVEEHSRFVGHLEAAGAGQAKQARGSPPSSPRSLPAPAAARAPTLPDAARRKRSSSCATRRAAYTSSVVCGRRRWTSKACLPAALRLRRRRCACAAPTPPLPRFATIAPALQC